MDTNPFISVVMPVYNSEKYLEEAIISILNQTYKNFEFIIVYDQSDDSSIQIIHKYKNKDQRIIVLHNNGKSIVSALNLGIMNSKGSFIARMDADDISLPKRFLNQIKYMQKFNLDICGCQCKYIYKKNKYKKINFPISHETCLLSLMFKVPFAHPTVIIKKNFLLKNKLKYGQSFYENAEDYDLWIRMYEKGAKFGNLDETLLHYRDLKYSLSSINRKKVLEETRNISKKFFIKNKIDIYQTLILKNNLSKGEQIIKIIAILVFFGKTLNFKILKNLKYLEKVNIIHGIFAYLKYLKTY
tara:strand:- start:8704 stop:9603 length:900 start_codon:yes stop_codon:yes gene_type:complete